MGVICVSKWFNPQWQQNVGSSFPKIAHLSPVLGVTNEGVSSGPAVLLEKEVPP